MAKTLKTIEQFESIRQGLIDKNVFSCKPKPFSASSEWGVQGGVIGRKDRNFFSITGLQVRSGKEIFPVSECPIIYQPTNAINGFLINRDGDELKILFQARLEPGNIGGVQLAPTVQSTEANYKRVHGGKPTSFIHSFLEYEESRCLYRGLQSEEGSRYHGKYNLYTIVEAYEEEFSTDKDDFFILGAAQIREFVCLDSVINTDARGLLFFLDWNLLGGEKGAFQTVDNPVNRALALSYCHAGDGAGTPVLEAVKHLTHARANSAISAWHIPLEELENWELRDDSLRECEENLGFCVQLYEVNAAHREVARWDQPLISSNTEGDVVLFCRVNRGVMEFLLSLDHEMGYLEGVQYTASVSLAPGKREHLYTEEEHLLLDTADSAGAADVLVDSRQSEEGGRFYHDVNRYRIIMVDSGFAPPASSMSRWMTLSQIKALGNISSMLSIELRCTLALLIKRA